MSAGCDCSTEQIAGDIAAIRRDLEALIGPLLTAVKRKEHYDEMQRRLRVAEDIAEARKASPLIFGVHDVIVAMRDEPQPQHTMIEQLCDVLFRSAGIEEFGFPQEVVDPVDVEVVASSGQGDRIVVEHCHRPGLRLHDRALRKARVTVTRREVSA